MSFNVKAILKITFENKCEFAQTIYNSIFAEVINPANIGKIKTNIYFSDDLCSINIEVFADTLSHARAFLNSILYLINASLETLNAIKNMSSYKN
ncbi:KEOPS complex subunit Pcc1 [Ignisphaera sp. 4213-co]|uniref:KEOPS complex subunit Pcc1 n=1 Tax=Ignisphaera cupida TaxID=3050454 RepID=A0ABD4Z6L8_9CREN|nr:KEOPS complex subunit Pcc1 [Ignisphaera sp. 4213-co]MDK6028263.1 KEOPS complex subunit Pcc1 [Ignisphaera sp. 4213-co]